jgi:pimeloyl-ACP methyl ester carboxylesterase
VPSRRHCEATRARRSACGADSDPVLALEPMGRAVESLFATAAPLTVVEEAGHFLQEDQDDQISALVADWLPAVA